VSGLEHLQDYMRPAVAEVAKRFCTAADMTLGFLAKLPRGAFRVDDLQAALKVSAADA
jgi:hypothetical protein